MTVLLLFFLVAFLLFAALISFLKAEPHDAVEEFPYRSSPSRFTADRELVALGDLVFSDQDWLFIRREQSAYLAKLYLRERRALARHWLKESGARIRSIRIRHIQSSRLSGTLNVFAEGKLLLLFFYLSLLRRALLVLVHFSNPAAPRALVRHFQSLASRLAFDPPAVLVPVAGDPRTGFAP